MVGELPGDFLRAGIPVPQVQENQQVTRILHAQQQAGVNIVTTSNYLGRLSISVVQVREDAPEQAVCLLWINCAE